MFLSWLALVAARWIANFFLLLTSMMLATGLRKSKAKSSYIRHRCIWLRDEPAKLIAYIATRIPTIRTGCSSKHSTAHAEKEPLKIGAAWPAQARFWPERDVHTSQA